MFVYTIIQSLLSTHALDFVDIVSALSADPFKAEEEAFKYTDFPYACGADHPKGVQAKVKALLIKEIFGPFANAYYGHSTYRFTPEQNLIALSHYLECLRTQRIVAQMMAIFVKQLPPTKPLCW